MASNRMTLVKNAAQIAAEEAATYGSSYGLLSGLTAYAPDFLRTVTGYGQAYFGPVMPAFDAAISTLVRIPGDVYNKAEVLKNVGKNVASGVVAAYAVQAISNVSGLQNADIDPNFRDAVRVLVEGTATSLTARALRFAGEKAATLSIFNRKATVNNVQVYENLLNANGAAASDNAVTQQDIEAQQEVRTSPRPGQSS